MTTNLSFAHNSDDYFLITFWLLIVCRELQIVAFLKLRKCLIEIVKIIETANIFSGKIQVYKDSHIFMQKFLKLKF